MPTNGTSSPLRGAHPGRVNLGLLRVACCAAVVPMAWLLLCLGGDAAARPPAPPFRGAPLTEVERLLERFEDKDVAVRERAFSELFRFGPSALDTARYAWRRGGPQAARLCFQLHAALQGKHGVRPTRSGGLEFRPFADAEWGTPRRGGDVKLGLEVKNVSRGPLLFPAVGGSWMGLARADGTPVPFGWKSFGPPPRKRFVVIGAGEAHRLSGFGGRLNPKPDGMYSFVVEHPAWYTFVYTGLRPGGHFVLFSCDNSKVPDSPAAPCWTGEVSTELMAISIQ